ncbi:MAG: hypothetical protein P8Z81_16410 [Deinococcales bacterium]
MAAGLLIAAALALGTRAGAGAPADTELSLLPGIAFAWTGPGAEALLAFQLGHGPADTGRVTNVRLPAKALSVSGFHFEPAGERLLLRVRAARSGTTVIHKLVLELQDGTARSLGTGAAEVVALPAVAGPLALRAWASDDDAGLYAAFALVNVSPVPVTARTLRYAPTRIGRGLVLTGSGPPDAFSRWKDAVLKRMAPAFGTYLQAGGADPHAPSRRAPSRRASPVALAFPLTGALSGARWQAGDALDRTIAPGEALYLAITPAAFTTYVGDLAITAYPVLGYAVAGDCCRLQGVPAPIVRVAEPGRPPAARP